MLLSFGYFMDNVSVYSADNGGTEMEISFLMFEKTDYKFNLCHRYSLSTMKIQMILKIYKFTC